MNIWQRFVALFLFLKVVFSKKVRFDDLSIYGVSTFKSEIQNALSLLKEKSPEAYQTVKENVGAIYQCQEDQSSTFGGGRGTLAFDIIANQSTVWTAGKIYCESKKISIKRSIQYSGRRPNRSDYNYEKVADDHYRIMTEIGADYAELKHLAAWIEALYSSKPKTP